MPDMNKMDTPIAADIPVTRSHMQLSYRMLRYHMEATGGDAAFIQTLSECSKTDKLDQIAADYDRTADHNRATTRKSKKAITPTERDIRFLLSQLCRMEHNQDREEIAALAGRYGFDYPLFDANAKPKRK